MERISEIIRNGAHTWMRNPVLCAPFLLGYLSSILFSAFILAGLAIIIGTETIMTIASMMLELMEASRYTGEPQIETMYELYHLLAPYTGIIIGAFIIMMIGSVLISAFFEAGAIGMAKDATMTDTTRARDLFYYGGRSVIDLFLANILIGLMFAAGIVFLAPGAALIRISGSTTVHVIIIFIGIVLFILYAIILAIGMAPVKYVLVVNRLGAIEGIKRGWDFFSDHKPDVLLMLLVTIGISMLFGLIGQIFYINPVTAMIWKFVSMLINLCILMPLITIWWTRLYISREIITADMPAPHPSYQ